MNRQFLCGQALDVTRCEAGERIGACQQEVRNDAEGPDVVAALSLDLLLSLVNGYLLWWMGHAVAAILGQRQIIVLKLLAVAKVNNFDGCTSLFQVFEVPRVQLRTENLPRPTLLWILRKVKHDIFRL